MENWCNAPGTPVPLLPLPQTTHHPPGSPKKKEYVYCDELIISELCNGSPAISFLEFHSISCWEKSCIKHVSSKLIYSSVSPFPPSLSLSSLFCSSLNVQINQILKWFRKQKWRNWISYGFYLQITWARIRLVFLHVGLKLHCLCSPCFESIPIAQRSIKKHIFIAGVPTQSIAKTVKS